MAVSLESGKPGGGYEPVKPIVSVVVPSYNSSATISKTLSCLMVQKGGLIDEIIVVDSSDDRKTGKVLSAYESDGVSVVSLSRKTIPAIARNIGVEKSCGDVVVFIDADAYPAEDWMESILAAYEDGCLVGGGSEIGRASCRERV